MCPHPRNHRRLPLPHSICLFSHLASCTGIFFSSLWSTGWKKSHLKKNLFWKCSSTHKHRENFIINPHVSTSPQQLLTHGSSCSFYHCCSLLLFLRRVGGETGVKGESKANSNILFYVNLSLILSISKSKFQFFWIVFICSRHGNFFFPPVKKWWRDLTDACCWLFCAVSLPRPQTSLEVPFVKEVDRKW